jgi:cation diffusion facilitator CzcD-associated flavoprotein CzcO
VYPRAPIHATFFRACVVIIGTGASASVAYPALAPRTASNWRTTRSTLPTSCTPYQNSERPTRVNEPSTRSKCHARRSMSAGSVQISRRWSFFTLLNALSSTPASTA